MTTSLYELQPSSDPDTWLLPITPELCAGPTTVEPFLYGGVGLAAGIGAMERVTGRPLIWASAQYLSFAHAGSTLELAVQVPAHGRTIAHARVSGRVNGEEIIAVTGSLGSRPDQPNHQWQHAPAMPPPEECEPVRMWLPQHPDARISQRIESRMIPGEQELRERDGVPSESGRILVWMRWAEDVPLRAGVLAILADFVPGVIALALGRHGGGSSLDNTLRVVRLVPSEWVLCEVDAYAVDHGMGHGEMRMFAQTGELLAIGSQSCMLRFFGT